VSKPVDRQWLKDKIVEGREPIREARLALENQELDETLAGVKQYLHDAEDYADFALRLLDPELVS
jgi:hypothetical protein